MWSEKRQDLEQPLQEQLKVQQIEESTSSWNSFVIAIKNKSGKGEY